MTRREISDALFAAAERNERTVDRVSFFADFVELHMDGHYKRFDIDMATFNAAPREALDELLDYELRIVEQCGQCGSEIVGHHACEGVPGGFNDD